MCMTDDGDDLLETARRIQAERKPKYSPPVSDEVGVALGRLLAAIDGARAEIDVTAAAHSAPGQQAALGLLIGSVCSVNMREILAAKARYDAARLAHGDRTLPVIGLNVQGDELADGIGGEIG